MVNTMMIVNIKRCGSLGRKLSNNNCPGSKQQMQVMLGEDNNQLLRVLFPTLLIHLQTIQTLPSSGGSHVETDRRRLISVEAISNRRRFIPQSVTRDIISIVITWMPTPIEKWKEYPIRVKDDLFRDFMESFDTKMQEKYGEDASLHPMVDSEVWAEASGPKKKRRVLGCQSLDIDTHGYMARSSKVNGISYTVAPTQECVKEAVNTAMTSFVQTQLMPMLEPILSMIGGSQFKNLKPQAPLQVGVREEEEDDE